MSHSHDDVSHSHSHGGGGDHGHTHEILDGPGSFLGREMPIIEGRDWEERSFTIGIGGYVVLPCASIHRGPSSVPRPDKVSYELNDITPRPERDELVQHTMLT